MAEEATPHAEIYKENVRRQIERAVDRIRDRPDLSGWLYELTGSSIPHSVYEDEKVHGIRSIDMMGTDIDGVKYNKEFNMGLPPFCDICGEELLERNSKCWNEKCVLSPIFSGNFDELSSNLAHSATSLITENKFSCNLLKSKRIRLINNGGLGSISNREDNNKKEGDKNFLSMPSHVLGRNPKIESNISNFYCSAEEVVFNSLSSNEEK